MALDGREHDIACSQIDIGNAETEFTQPMAEGIRQADGSTKVEERMDVAHVASAVLFMANLPLDANVLFPPFPEGSITHAAVIKMKFNFSTR